MKNFLTCFLIFFSFKAMCQDGQLKNDWADLKKYSQDNMKLIKLGPDNKRVVFMGNSITEFWLYTDKPFFESRPYVNRGISGQTTPQMLERFRQDVIDLKPAVVVILAGINDIAENAGPMPLKTTFANIVSMAEMAKTNHIRVVISSVLPALGFPWRPGINPVEKIISLNAMLRSYCTTHKIVYLDYYSKMVDENKGLDKRYADDGVHPTLAGYKVMEPLVEAAIKLAFKLKAIP